MGKRLNLMTFDSLCCQKQQCCNFCFTCYLHKVNDYKTKVAARKGKMYKEASKSFNKPGKSTF